MSMSILTGVPVLISVSEVSDRALGVSVSDGDRGKSSVLELVLMTSVSDIVVDDDNDNSDVVQY